jgi:hypothetical protein
VWLICDEPKAKPVMRTDGFVHNDLKNEYAQHFLAVDAVFGAFLDVRSTAAGLDVVSQHRGGDFYNRALRYFAAGFEVDGEIARGPDQKATSPELVIAGCELNNRPNGNFFMFIRAFLDLI